MYHLFLLKILNENFNPNDIYSKDVKRPVYADESKEIQRLENKKIKEYTGRERFGFLAQELKEVFPEVVEYDKENDSYGIKYTALIPVIIEGIKEQQNIIDAQTSKITELENEIKELKGHKGVTKKKSLGIDKKSAVNAFLYQNNPNPFSGDTEIKYFLQGDIQKASIFIFDMTGTLLKTYNISGKSSGFITVNGSTLKPGMYLYSLIVDEKEIDTKRMILTK